MNLVPLFEEALEFQDYNGTVLSDGKVAVYYIGRTRLADIYEDVAAEYPAENPRILNNLGMGPVYVNPAFDYEMVVFDAYGSELFSVKKYLASKGEHSTANVVVTPSESIAVSAWTVGDVQVYMPYLTGQLGKVYEGIDPIVVNNQVDKISANHVPLGVQDPLYFVQDDENACIIGFSGQEVDPTQFVPWSASGTFQTSGDYYSASNPSGFITSVDLAPYAKIEDLTAYQEKGNYYSASNPSGFLNKESADTLYQEKGNYQTAGNYYSASNPSGFINSDAISAMATTGFVADVSADITAMIPTALTGNYLTKESADTLYQPIGQYQSALTFNYTNDNEISGINGSAIYSQGGGGVTGDFTLVEGNGIQLTDDPIAQTTTISVSGDYATVEDVESATSSIPTIGTAEYDGEFVSVHTINNLPIWSNYSNWADAADRANEAKWDSTNRAISALPNSATVNSMISSSITSKADVTALSNYQTTAGMTAYQPAGDYLTTGDSANFYTTANESGFITGIPAGTMNESAFGYDASNNITGYNGSAIGGDVPEGVMVESGLEYDNTKISGYSGSAFKDVALTDVVTANSGAWGGSALPISAGPGIGLSMVNGVLVISVTGGN